MKSTFMRGFGAFLIVLTIIDGICAGFLFKTINEDGIKKFNTSLMIIVWASSVVLIIIVYAISQILENQEAIIQMLEKNKPEVKKTSTLDSITHTIAKTPTYFDNVGTWECKNCGYINSEKDKFCRSCKEHR